MDTSVFTPDSGSKRVFGIIGIRAQSRAYWGRVLPSSTHAWSCMSVGKIFGKNLLSATRGPEVFKFLFQSVRTRLHE